MVILTRTTNLITFLKSENFIGNLCYLEEMLRRTELTENEIRVKNKKLFHIEKSCQQMSSLIQTSEGAMENVIKCCGNGCNIKRSSFKEKLYEKIID